MQYEDALAAYWKVLDGQASGGVAAVGALSPETVEWVVARMGECYSALADWTGLKVKTCLHLRTDGANASCASAHVHAAPPRESKHVNARFSPSCRSGLAAWQLSARSRETQPCTQGCQHAKVPLPATWPLPASTRVTCRYLPVALIDLSSSRLPILCRLGQDRSLLRQRPFVQDASRLAELSPWKAGKGSSITGLAFASPAAAISCADNLHLQVRLHPHAFLQVFRGPIC